MSNVPIISVTGTKGKTTTVSIIDSVLRQLGKNVLKVDTTGHFVNGKRRSTLDDSKATWKLVPTVCPGRYLWEFSSNSKLCDNGVAVLECALGSSASPGLGYSRHDVGVFLNVFEDHLGSSERLKSKIDIMNAKKFIFSQLKNNNSYAVFNADDNYVVEALSEISELAKNVNLIAVGLDFNKFSIDEHLKSGGVVVTVNDSKEVVIRSSKNDIIVADLNMIPWTFNGSFIPSIFNILASVGALYGYFNGQLPDNFRQAVEMVRFDNYGGRLTSLKSVNGVKIIADYAHEKVSLFQVAKLAHNLVDANGRVIGVVRLAHDRTDELIAETGEVIAKSYDEIIVYDKIDGYFRKASQKISRFKQVEGRTSKLLYDSIIKINKHATRIIREDEAIAFANKIAKPGDVVVVIVNDNVKRSIDFIKNNFRAEFV